MANKAIKREHHPVPTIDDLIHTWNGATIFFFKIVTGLAKIGHVGT